MAASLEHRRLAIVAALRAVMAEPLPNGPRPADTPVAISDTPQRRSLRDVLVAEIDWDEPERLEVLDDVDRSREDLTSPDDLSTLEDLDDDWEAPSVPPLETAGSMSRVASLALFGHA